MTGRPISEAAVLGIGGGLGAGYILWQFAAHGPDQRDRRVVTLGFRRQWQYPDRWYVATCGALGQPVEVHETAGRRSAADHLDVALRDGRPAIAFVSAADLPYWHLPDEESGWWGHVVVVYAAADGAFLVDDRNRAALRVGAGDLAAARGRIGSYRNRLLVVAPEDVSEAAWVGAVRQGLTTQVEHLSTRSDSFGLPAFAKWARLLTHPTQAKAWPVVFADDGADSGAGVGLVDALASVHAAVAVGHGGAAGCSMVGGNLRATYAEFLTEVAGPALEADLTGAAEAYLIASTRWQALAELVREVPSVAAVISADEARWRAVVRGDAGAGDAASAARTAADARASGSRLTTADRAALFAAMSAAVTAVYDAELAALAELRGAVG